MHFKLWFSFAVMVSQLTNASPLSPLFGPSNPLTTNVHRVSGENATIEKRMASPDAILKKRYTAELYQAGTFNFYGQPTPVVGLDNHVGTYFQAYDGNFVVYSSDTTAPPTGVLWDSGTVHSAGCHTNNCEIVFQYDGNLVIYIEGTAAWWTNTFGSNPGEWLGFYETSPYIVIWSASNTILWEAT
jgi:hypothetical protein